MLLCMDAGGGEGEEMSWEVFGSDDPFDIDLLYKAGWHSDEACEKWWQDDDASAIYTTAEAIEFYEREMWDE